MLPVVVQVPLTGRTDGVGVWLAPNVAAGEAEVGVVPGVCGPDVVATPVHADTQSAPAISNVAAA